MTKLTPEDLKNLEIAIMGNPKLDSAKAHNSKEREKLDKFSEINPPNAFPTPEDFDPILEGEQAWEREREEDALQIHQGNFGSRWGGK